MRSAPSCLRAPSEEFAGTQNKIDFGRLGRRVIEAHFSCGDLPSECGRLPWPHVDERQGLSSAAAAAIPDPRDPGLARNARLHALVQGAEASLADAYTASGSTQRLIGVFSYTARSWSHERRVVTRLEHGAQDSNSHHPLRVLFAVAAARRAALSPQQPIQCLACALTPTRPAAQAGAGARTALRPEYSQSSAVVTRLHRQSCSNHSATCSNWPVQQRLMRHPGRWRGSLP